MIVYKFAAVALIALAPAFAQAQTATTTVTTSPESSTTIVTPAVSSSASSTTTTHHSATVTDLETEKNMTPDGKNAFEAERNAATDTAPKPVEVKGATTTESSTTTTETHSHHVE